MKQKLVFTFFLYLLMGSEVLGQEIMATGGKPMPASWIDSATGHLVKRLTIKAGDNLSFYFHNNPFVGNEMVFYGTDNIPTSQKDANFKQESYNLNSKNKQLFKLNLSSGKIEQLTKQVLPMNGEILGRKSKQVFYQIKDSIFSTHIETKRTRLIYVFPPDFKGSMTCLNASEKLLGGVWSGDAEKELFKKYPNKSSYFDVIYDAHLPRTLFTINIETGQLQKVFTDSAWLNHVQFSPTDPNLMMFCHEGPWHKVDRIWTIDIEKRVPVKMHTRTMDMEIAGHEWFSKDGSMIWYDLQTPRSKLFFIAGVSLITGERKKFSIQRDEWSIHFNANKDQSVFCGDGGDPRQVARASDGQWIYLFKPNGDKMNVEKLVEMKNHNYKLEPNVHFSPDEEWVIFRANFEGSTQVYAVSIAGNHGKIRK
jgi:oligogalacturonide lyase